MDIRLLTEDDTEGFWKLRLQALKLHPEAFGSDYEESKDRSIEAVHERMRTHNLADDNFVVGAFRDGELAGTAGFFREDGIKSRHKGTIWGVFVKPDVRGKHVGRLLMEAAIEKAGSIEGIEQVHLMVTVSNTRAHGLYRSLGFKEYGIEPRSLKVGDAYYDEALMVLRLR